MSQVSLMAGVTAPAAIFPRHAEIYPGRVDPAVGATPIAAGQPVYQTSAGLINLASSLTAGSAQRQAKGIALEGGGPRNGLSVLKRGHVGGYNLAGLSPGQQIFLNDAAGTLGTAAGTTSVLVGSVVMLSDGMSLAIYFDFGPGWLDSF